MKTFFVTLIFGLCSYMSHAQNSTSGSCDGVPVHLIITLDFFGSETAWALAENPEALPYVGNLGNVIQSVPFGEYEDNMQGQQVFQNFCLPSGCYTLVVFDEWGDGMAFTQGSYQIFVGDSLVGEGGMNFGAWSSVVFCVQEDISPVFGCTDDAACNFNPFANQSDESCVYPGFPCVHADSVVVFETYNDECECQGVVLSGCTDESAFNFDPTATSDDGSCYYHPGCNVEGACNFNPLSDWNDGSCDFVSCMVIGCMDELANNYDSLATLPNPNACLYQTVSFSVVQNCKEIMLINTTPDAPVPGPGVFFIWEFGDGESLTTLDDTLYYGYENGSYTITLIYAQGMSLQSVSYDITVSDFLETPELQLVGQTLVCSADAVEYRWFLDQVEIAITSDNVLEVNATGEYRCQLVGHGGCLTSSLPYIVNTVSLEEMKDAQPFIAPTLVNTDFTVRNIEGPVSIYNIFSGQKVWEGNVFDGVQVDCSFMSAGSYILIFPEGRIRFVKN